jgi:pilus assembly protein CpaF
VSLLKRLEREKSRKNDDTVQTLRPQDEEIVVRDKLKSISRPDTVDIFTEWKIRLHQKIVGVLLEQGEQGDLDAAILQVIEEDGPPLPRHEKERMIQELRAEANGFGPIDALLHDDEVTEVMVNSSSQVYVERHGRLELTPVKFLNDAHVMRVIEKIVSPLGRRIDEASPMVDARLPDGSRVNAIIPPLSVRGPSVTIRKFSRDPYQVEDLISFGTMSVPMARFLEACVYGRLNIVVSGGTGSGKSTTLNVISSFIPEDERVVTIEDAAELQLRQAHVVTLETRPPNIEGKGAVTIRDLVRNSLRMRPDRIVVGEVRGGEALDMLQAMNTGHDGSLTTAHANSPRDCIRRLEVMTLMAGMELPLRAIREQIASAVNLIVQQARLRDGSRKIVQISEVMGMEGEQIVLQDIFAFKETGRNEMGKIIGKHEAVGIVPGFIEQFREEGIPFDYSWFRTEETVWR